MENSGGQQQLRPSGGGGGAGGANLLGIGADRALMRVDLGQGDAQRVGHGGGP